MPSAAREAREENEAKKAAKAAEKAAKRAARLEKKASRNGSAADLTKLDELSLDAPEEMTQAELDAKFRHRNVTGVLSSRANDLNVKITSFTMIVHGQEMVQDTELELTQGRRYGLMGRNGTGKTNLLQAIAYREIPIPESVDIFFLNEEAEKTELTALEYVVAKVKAELQRLEDFSHKLMEEDPEDPMLYQIFEKIESMDPTTFETRAAELLHGLGFNRMMMARATKDMSGGWRMRVALAQALFVQPSVLLLDEPTNHLDLEAVVWLENYLSNYPNCLVMVSHSQDFMNAVCTHIMHLYLNKLTVYTGNYDQYVKTRRENEITQQRAHDKEQEDIKHLKEFIASCGTYSNLVRQAKSKQKIIDKMMEAGLTPKVVKETEYVFRFPETSKLPPPVMQFNDVCFSYSGKKEDYLYTNVNLGVDMDSRVCLVGPNGAGKSTLLKLMCEELSPTEGGIRTHTHLNIGRYTQHTQDQLDLSMSALDFFREKFKDSVGEIEECRRFLGRYGCTGDQQTKPMSTLSDGQKSRVVFALISLQKPNLLLLDEPTNHLDCECIDSLADAIKVFDGGVVVVSHDFRLLSQVAKEIWVCDRGITKWQGDIQSYKKHLARGMGL